jgi:hypothetical protein
MFTTEQKEGIREYFEDADIKDAAAKFHENELDSSHIKALADLNTRLGLNVSVKRSGYGVTAYITSEIAEEVEG